VRSLEVERDCRTLILTPTLETQDQPLSGLASGHLTKPVCREALYDELLLLIHGIHSGGSQASAQAGLPASQRGVAGRAPRILAVDDNEANLKLVMTLLQDCRLEAESAASGFEALTKARQKPFDLVFMDLQMPGMDGVETTARIRALDSSAHHTPIIALTAHALADEQERLTKQGFDGYMPKPISSAQLVELVREFTGYECAAAAPRFKISEVRDTRRSLRPSNRRMQQDCVSIEESVQLAAGKADLAEELFSMLLEQLQTDSQRIPELWQNQQLDALLECVHKLHGATRYCGVPELRTAASRFETALKCQAADLELQKDQLLSAIDRLQVWSDKTDWQQQFRDVHQQSAAT
jgi:two-component system sensor histidine kinase BarA